MRWEPVALAVALVMGAGCASNAAARGIPPPSPATGQAGLVTCPAPPPGWVDHETDDLCISTRSGWTFRDQNPAPLLVSPPILLAVGSWSFPIGGDCAPTRALGELPKDGMFLWLFEYVEPAQRDPTDFIPRPKHFRLGKLLGPFECVGRKTYLILFREHRRFFQIHVVFGSRAPDSLRRQVLASLDSLVVEPPA